MRRLDGRIAVVTGGANGIGRGCALRFASEGATLAVIDREADALEALVAEVEGADGTILTRTADCTDADAARAFVEEVEGQFGAIDVLVNNVGQGARERKSTFLDSTEDVWRFVLELNLITTMRFSRLVAPGMVARQHGRIINMASEAFLTGPVGSHDYAAAKGGIVGFTRSVARELAPHGVTVNALLPGPIMTRALATSTDPVVHETMAQVPVGFVGEPEDIAAMATLVASDEGRFITGQCIVVNGGRWWL